MGGSLTVESERGVGSVFTMELPAAERHRIDLARGHRPAKPFDIDISTALVDQVCADLPP